MSKKPERNVFAIDFDEILKKHRRGDVMTSPTEEEEKEKHQEGEEKEDQNASSSSSTRVNIPSATSASAAAAGGGEEGQEEEEAGSRKNNNIVEEETEEGKKKKKMLMKLEDAISSKTASSTTSNYQKPTWLSSITETSEDGNLELLRFAGTRKTTFNLDRFSHKKRVRFGIVAFIFGLASMIIFNAVILTGDVPAAVVGMGAIVYAIGAMALAMGIMSLLLTIFENDSYLEMNHSSKTASGWVHYVSFDNDNRCCGVSDMFSDVSLEDFVSVSFHGYRDSEFVKGLPKHSHYQSGTHSGVGSQKDTCHDASQNAGKRSYITNGAIKLKYKNPKYKSFDAGTSTFDTRLEDQKDLYKCFILEDGVELEDGLERVRDWETYFLRSGAENLRIDRPWVIEQDFFSTDNSKLNSSTIKLDSIFKTELEGKIMLGIFGTLCVIMFGATFTFIGMSSDYHDGNLVDYNVTEWNFTCNTTAFDENPWVALDNVCTNGTSNDTHYKYAGGGSDGGGMNYIVYLAIVYSLVPLGFFAAPLVNMRVTRTISMKADKKAKKIHWKNTATYPCCSPISGMPHVTETIFDFDDVDSLYVERALDTSMWGQSAVICLKRKSEMSNSSNKNKNKKKKKNKISSPTSPQDEEKEKKKEKEETENDDNDDDDDSKRIRLYRCDSHEVTFPIMRGIAEWLKKTAGVKQTIHLQDPPVFNHGHQSLFERIMPRSFFQDEEEEENNNENEEGLVQQGQRLLQLKRRRVSDDDDDDDDDESNNNREGADDNNNNDDDEGEEMTLSPNSKKKNKKEKKQREGEGEEGEKSLGEQHKQNTYDSDAIRKLLSGSDSSSSGVVGSASADSLSLSPTKSSNNSSGKYDL